MSDQSRRAPRRPWFYFVIYPVARIFVSVGDQLASRQPTDEPE